MKLLTIKELKEIMKDLPEDTRIMYPYRYKGAGLCNYITSDIWVYDKEEKVLIIQPGPEFDPG
jgi:hypothetical protein